MAHDRPKLDLSGPQIIGGALAAASAAVASSWLGVAGTVLGAVIVSLVASVGSALYTHSLERSSRAIRETLPVVPVRSLGSTTATGAAGTPTKVLPAVAPELDPDASEQRVTSLAPAAGTRGVRWRTVAVSALASLALAAAVLTGFETLVGRPASSIIGAGDDSGTTVSKLVEHSSTSTTQNQPPAETTPGTGGSGATAGTDSGPTASADQGQPSQPSESAPTQSTPTGSTPTSGWTTGGTSPGDTPAQPTPTVPTPTTGN